MDTSWLLAVPVGLGVLLLARLGLWLWPLPVRKAKSKLPGRGWTLVYSDNTPGVRSGLLHAPAYQLQGKPDMIYAKGRKLIPAELKSGDIGKKLQPRDGDMMQLAVYFLLAEAEWGARPRKGLLIYNDGMFVIRNTRKLRNKLTRTLVEMENMLKDPGYITAEPGFIKCKHCLCRGTVCEASP